MLDWFRKPKADKPDDGKGAAPKPSEAVAKPPAAAGNASAPAEKPSGMASVPNGPTGQASEAHQMGHVAQNVRHETGEKTIATAGEVYSTVGKPSTAAAGAHPTGANALSTAANALSTAANTFPPAPSALPTTAIANSLAAKASSTAVNRFPTVSGENPSGSNASPAIPNTNPTVPKGNSATSAAPDRPAKLPPNIADSGATIFIPREEVKLQAPTIAVTVPASAVVSAPADKVKAASPPALPASPLLPADPGRGEGEKPLGSSAPAPAKIPPSSPSTQPSAPGGEGARSTANVPHGVPPSGGAASQPPKGGTPSPAPAPAVPKPATWKNLPAKEPWCPPAIAAQAPELRKVAAADAVAFERVLPGWRAAGASRRGRMHANGGTHREDSLAFDAHDRATVLCVSDGAGSCQHSRIGSHIAAHRVVEMLLAVTEKVDPVIAADATKLKEHLSAKVTEAVRSAMDELLGLAQRSGSSRKDFRCTLLTALHYRGEKHELLFTNQIGDGAIFVLRKDQSTARLGSSDSGSHSGEVWCFIPDDSAREKAKQVDVITEVAPIECVLLCSDGIEDPFYPLEKQAGEIFRQFYTGVTVPLPDFKAQLPQPAPLLQESAAWGLAQWLEFEKRGENDDRTVAVLHRLPVNVSF